MNKINIKTAQEIELMRESGRLLASVFSMLDNFVAAGVSTMAINDKVDAFITDVLSARPASKGQYDYPYVLNASINEVICHGMPDENRVLKDGDIINLDITLEKNGFIADSSKMYCIGKVQLRASRLVKATYEAMWQGIAQVKPGATLGDIVMRFKNMRKVMAILWSGNIAVMA